MRLLASLRAAVLLPAAGLLLSSVAAAAEPVTELRVYQLHQDGRLVSTEIGASARIDDTEATGTAEAVRFAFANGDSIGRLEEGFPQVAAGDTSLGAFTLQTFGPAEQLPEGPSTITFEGGSLDGWTVVHDLALAWLPRAPEVTPGAVQKLKNHAERKAVKVQLNGFTARRGAALAQAYLYLERAVPNGSGGEFYQTIFEALELAPSTRTVELPAHTLEPGRYRLNLVHVQVSPATNTSRPVTYYSANVLEFTRSR